MQHTSQLRPDSGLGLSHFQFESLETIFSCFRFARKQEWVHHNAINLPRGLKLDQKNRPCPTNLQGFISNPLKKGRGPITPKGFVQQQSSNAKGKGAPGRKSCSTEASPCSQSPRTAHHHPPNEHAVQGSTRFRPPRECTHAGTRSHWIDPDRPEGVEPVAQRKK